MEADEVRELEEQTEQARENSLRPVSFTMSVLAVLVAVTTVLGHRSHTQAVLNQARASDQWNLYQAKKIRSYSTQLSIDLLSTLPVSDAKAASSLTNSYNSHMAKWNDDLKDEETKATGLEEKVENTERRAARFDLSEALLEIALVVTSITLLTRLRLYWYLGMAFGAVGLAIATWAALIH